MFPGKISKVLPARGPPLQILLINELYAHLISAPIVIHQWIYRTCAFREGAKQKPFHVCVSHRAAAAILTHDPLLVASSIYITTINKM